jgi:hypothetical protein
MEKANKVIFGKYVLAYVERYTYANPNFMGTGMGLCGILRKGESLQQFQERQRDNYREAARRTNKTFHEFKKKYVKNGDKWIERK